MRTVLVPVVFWIAVAGCAIAQFFIFRAVLRSDVASPLEANPLVHASTISSRRQSGRVAEVVWAVIPALFLVAAFVLAWRAMHS